MYDTSLIKSSGGKGPLKLQQPFLKEGANSNSHGLIDGSPS